MENVNMWYISATTELLLALLFLIALLFYRKINIKIKYLKNDETHF